MFVIFAGILSAIAITIVMFRIGMDKFAGYPAVCDTAVTISLTFLLFGTWSGMVAAIIGGLTFSAILTLYRYLHGYSRFSSKGWNYHEGKGHEKITGLLQNMRNRRTMDKQIIYK